MEFKVGDKVKDSKGDEGIIAGELRIDGYYPVKLLRLAHLSGVVHIKPQSLTKMKGDKTIKVTCPNLYKVLKALSKLPQMDTPSHWASKRKP